VWSSRRPSEVWCSARISPIAPAGDRLDVPGAEHVLLAAEAVAGVGGDHGRAALGIDAGEQGQGGVDRVLGHVRDVDQHALVGRRPDRRPTGGEQRLGGLGEHHAPQGIGKKGNGVRDLGHAAVEEVADGEVGDTALGQLGDPSGDAVGVWAEVEGALHAVH
jgi:hypothetical protein